MNLIEMVAAGNEIISRLEDGELIDYEDMEGLDDMALGLVRQSVELVEVGGDGYRKAQGE